MPPRLSFNIGWKRVSLYVVGSLFPLSLVLAASSADASFKAFLPGGDGAVFPSAADGRATTTPSIQAYHLPDGEHIKLDGRLDDSAWEKIGRASCRERVLPTV